MVVSKMALVAPARRAMAMPCICLLYTSAARYHGQNILLVSHGASIRALISAALGLDLFTMHNLWIGGNTALSRVRFREGHFYLDLHNDTAHLEEGEA